MHKKLVIFFVLFQTIVFGQTDPNIVIGKRTILSTSLNLATKFVSPTGTGNTCTETQPCNFITAIESRVPGDVIFLRGGIYTLNERLYIDGSSGTQTDPIIIESYPNELAIIDGQKTANDEINELSNVGIMIRANFIYFRNLEVKRMSRAGIQIGGSYNKIEGCHIHHNLASGILIYDMDNFYQTPYLNGYNVIKDNEINDNSDAGIPNDSVHNDGDNADGIAISSGKFNRIENNTIYHNSDDGIDSWRSNDTEIGFNLVYNQGLGALGNGNGIKTGGNLDPNPPNGLRAHAYHNIVYGNRSDGFDFNAGNETIWEYNTSYQNQGAGFVFNEETVVQYNIANANSNTTVILSNTIDNSWQRTGNVSFMSTDPNSSDFLKPTQNSGFEDIGAYAIEQTANVFEELNSPILMFPNPLIDDIIHFHTNDIQIQKVAIYNALGKIVFIGKPEENKITIPKLSIGIYTIRIETSNNHFMKQLIKTN